MSTPLRVAQMQQAASPNPLVAQFANTRQMAQQSAPQLLGGLGLSPAQIDASLQVNALQPRAQAAVNGAALGSNLGQDLRSRERHLEGIENNLLNQKHLEMNDLAAHKRQLQLEKIQEKNKRRSDRQAHRRALTEIDYENTVTRQREDEGRKRAQENFGANLQRMQEPYNQWINGGKEKKQAKLKEEFIRQASIDPSVQNDHDVANPKKAVKDVNYLARVQKYVEDELINQNSKLGILHLQYAGNKLLNEEAGYKRMYDEALGIAAKQGINISGGQMTGGAEPLIGDQSSNDEGGSDGEYSGGRDTRSDPTADPTADPAALTGSVRRTDGSLIDFVDRDGEKTVEMGKIPERAGAIVGALTPDLGTAATTAGSLAAVNQIQSKVPNIGDEYNRIDGEKATQQQRVQGGQARVDKALQAAEDDLSKTTKQLNKLNAPGSELSKLRALNSKGTYGKTGKNQKKFKPITVAQLDRLRKLEDEVDLLKQEESTKQKRVSDLQIRQTRVADMGKKLGPNALYTPDANKELVARRKKLFETVSKQTGVNFKMSDDEIAKMTPADIKKYVEDNRRGIVGRFINNRIPKDKAARDRLVKKLGKAAKGSAYITGGLLIKDLLEAYEVTPEDQEAIEATNQLSRDYNEGNRQDLKGPDGKTYPYSFK